MAHVKSIKFESQNDSTHNILIEKAFEKFIFDTVENCRHTFDMYILLIMKKKQINREKMQKNIIDRD